MEGRVTANDLSNEVLWRVVENLRHSPETLAALTLTSRRFCELVKAVHELPIRDLYLLHDYARVTTNHDHIRSYTDHSNIVYPKGHESAFINNLRWARRAFLRKILPWLEPELVERRADGFYEVRIQLRCGRIHFQPYAWEAAEKAWDAKQETSVVLQDQAWKLKFARWATFGTSLFWGARCSGFTTPWRYTCQPLCDELAEKEDTWPTCSVCTCGSQFCETCPTMAGCYGYPAAHPNLWQA